MRRFGVGLRGVLSLGRRRQVSNVEELVGGGCSPLAKEAHGVDSKHAMCSGWDLPMTEV